MNAICDNTKFNRINNFQPLFWNNNEVLSWANILGSSVNVLIWSKRCVALYFCVCLHCCGHAVVCMCYVFVCIVAWHHLNNAFPCLKGRLWKPKGVSVNCLCGLFSCQCTKDHKWKIQRTKYMWNTHKTLIQKYETRNSNAVSVSLSFQCICADVSLSLLLCKLL